VAVLPYYYMQNIEHRVNTASVASRSPSVLFLLASQFNQHSMYPTYCYMLKADSDKSRLLSVDSQKIQHTQRLKLHYHYANYDHRIN